MDINYLRKKEVSTDELLRYVRFNLSVELGETELLSEFDDYYEIVSILVNNNIDMCVREFMSGGSLYEFGDQMSKRILNDLIPKMQDNFKLSLILWLEKHFDFKLKKRKVLKHKNSLHFKTVGQALKFQQYNFFEHHNN